MTIFCLVLVLTPHPPPPPAMLWTKSTQLKLQLCLGWEGMGRLEGRGH